jgi:TPR repeat protein
MQEALMDYGALLLQGIGGERDDAQARDIFTRAAELHGTPNAMFALGALYGGGHQIETDRETSLSWYRRAADKGHARAAIMLGKYLRYGIATAVDLDAARNWFTFAATNGLADEANAELAALDLSPAPTTPEEAA